MRTRRNLKIRREGERGFALLVVFLVAAGIMISLYMEIPRVGFESQRNREEILIERGEQYSRAIEMFYRKTKRYPQKIEDLESFNNQRFLRRRYKDPLTGKDEWRMVHMGPAGLSDSLVEKPGQVPGKAVAGASGQPGAPGQPVTDPAQTGGVPTGVPGEGDTNLAMNRIRQSDRNPGGRGQAPGFGQPGFDPNNPTGQQQQQLGPDGQVINDPNQVNANNNNQFPNNNGGFNPNSPASFNNNNPNGGYNPNPQGYTPGFPQQPNFPGQTNFNGPPGINPGGVQPGGPGQPAFFQNGQAFSPGAQLQGQLGLQNGTNPANSGFPQNPALNAINNQLRNQSGFPQPGSGYGPSGYGGNPSDPNFQLPPGATKLADGGVRFPDGTVINKDGTPRQPSNVPPGAPPGPGGFAPSAFGPQGQNGQPGGSGFGNPLATSQPGGGQTFGGAGIAGVASTQAGVGIKRYNDRSKYKEWEFIFDYRKPKTKATVAAAPTGLTPSSGFGANPAATPPPATK